MDQIASYLHIESDYAQPLGGLCWSASGDAVEYEGVGTFALGAQIAFFLEGYAASGRLIHFTHVLHLLSLLGLGGRKAPPAEAEPLAAAFRETGSPLRNAGAFCAVLCRGVPALADPPDAKQICLWLRGVLHFHPHPRESTGAEVCAWSAQQFEAHVLKTARAYSREEMAEWFRHGRGPVHEAARQIAQEITAARPRSLAEILESLTKRERLAGAAPFVAQLVSALTLPPRRLAHQELPVGGFADVTTRGHPEHLLPSQFALDSLEFIRRYAENELLFFHRDEPHTRLREELIVLLDQGVRTWGDVRLMLTAAVVAFGKLAARRRLTFRIATTSGGGLPFDALAIAERDLGERLEASDLSAHPGLALERTLEQLAVEGNEPDSQSRCTDLVMLTHPRSFLEPDVASAALRVAARNRLFAVTVDDEGDVQFSELRHGAPLRLTSFRVDPELTQTAIPRVEARQEARWQGDIEGTVDRSEYAKIRSADFDESGEWLLVVTGNGRLFAWNLNDARIECWPRGVVDGKPLTRWASVLGIPHGFVVAAENEHYLPCLFQYHVGNRRCRRYNLPSKRTSILISKFLQWSYYRHWHSVVMSDPDRKTYLGVDLETGTVYRSGESHDESARRVYSACIEAYEHGLPLLMLPVVTGALQAPPLKSCIEFDQKRGSISVTIFPRNSFSFTPQADGRSVLKDCVVSHAWYRGGILALAYRRSGNGTNMLGLFRAAEGTPLFEHKDFPHGAVVAISQDGRRIAFQVSKRRMKVGALDGSGGYYLVTFDVKREVRKLASV